MKPEFKIAATLLLLAGLAGCDSIGDGSTIEKLEIIPVSSATQHGPFTQGDTYKLLQCFRDEFVVIATFTDGTQANFSNRATWSTSDPAVVEVSNFDIPVVFATSSPAENGSFYVHDTFKYVRGTVVPKGVPGDTAVVSAQFASLNASINVEIRKPTLRIVPVPNDAPATVVDPVHLGQGTFQRLAVIADVGGRTVSDADLSSGSQNSFNINPFRWLFTDPTTGAVATFEPFDPEVSGDFDKWVITDGADRIATISAGGGIVRGVEADFTPYEVVAEQYLCPAGDAALRPATNIQVATFHDDPETPADDRFVLAREAGLQVSGFAAEDQVMGTNQLLQLRGKLDANGDGTLVVEQNLNVQSQYQVMPLNETCEDSDAQLGCANNSHFLLTSNGVLVPGISPAEGGVGRGQACFPVCLPTQATLTADATTVDTGVAVNFTATAINPPPGVTVNYLFDFGDGITAGPQASATASHPYADPATVTATVRIVDAAFPAEFLSQNAGAVRITVAVTAPPLNTVPTAAVTVSPTSGSAPLLVVLNAGNSSDPDSGDGVTVYEFDFGDGTPVVRQTQATLTHYYMDGTGSPFTPTIKVYDESGASTVASGTAVTVTGVAADVVRSNVLDFRARDATLCSVEIQPPLAAATTEAAFTFPGTRFQAVGSFVANTDSDACTDPVIGSQRITRQVFWFARPAGSTSGVSDIVGVRSTGSDYQSAGQVLYFANIASDTTVDITGTLISPFADSGVTPANSSLTVTPCTGCLP